MPLPKNGDAVIEECINCGNHFEEPEKLGSFVKCKEEEGGCGFHFKITVKTGKLETED